MLVEINTQHFKRACAKAMVRLADATKTIPKHGDADRADYNRRQKQVEIIVDALALASLTKSNDFWLDLPTYRLVCDDWPELHVDGRVKEETVDAQGTVSGRSHALGLPPQKKKGEVL